jgi:hypothetical protein
MDPSSGTVRITFRDSLTALAPGSILDPNNFTLSIPSGRTARSFSLASLTLAPGDPNTVVANFGAALKSGAYVLTIRSAGINDLAGNTLVERTFTAFPGINPPAGSNYVAQISTDGKTASGPQLYVPHAEVIAAGRHSKFLRSRLGIRRKR